MRLSRVIPHPGLMKEKSIILTAVADVVDVGGGEGGGGGGVGALNDPSAWEQLTLFLVIVHEECDSVRGGKALRSDAADERKSSATLTTETCSLASAAGTPGSGGPLLRLVG